MTDNPTLSEKLEPCPWCPTTRRETYKTEGGTVGVIIHDTNCFLAVCERRQVLTPKGVIAWNSRTPVVAPQKDLRIYDRENNVVTQGAFNALMDKVDSLTEDAELAAEDADRLRSELGNVYANMLRESTPPAASDDKCLLCGHERKFYNAEAEACEHTTGLTKPQFDVFCGCACRFAAASSPASSPTPLIDAVIEVIAAEGGPVPTKWRKDAATPTPVPEFKNTKEAMEYAARHNMPSVIPVSAAGGDEDTALLTDDDAALTAHAIRVAREVQEFIWTDCYPSLRPYDAEGWRRLFQKRVDCIAEVDLTRHSGLAALRKRLLQQAALSIKALALVNRWAKNNPPQLSTGSGSADLRADSVGDRK